MTAAEQVSLYLQGSSGVRITYPPQGAASCALSLFLLFVCVLVLLQLLARLHGVRSLLAPRLERFRRPFWRFAKNAVIIAIFFMLWELALTLFITAGLGGQHAKYLPDPLLLWRQSPGWRGAEFGVDVTFNSLGLRDREIPLKKEEGELRILSLGASNAYGHGISLEDTYAKRLEGLLQKRFPRRAITVVNGGVQGYTVMQGYFLFREVGLRYAPDVVLVGTLHDMNPGIRQGAPMFYDYLFLRPRFSPPPARLALQTALLKLNLYNVFRSEILRFRTLPMKDSTASREESGAAGELEERLFFFQMLADECRRREISVLFTDVEPSLASRIAAGRRIRVVSARSFHFSLVSRWQEYMLPYDRGHYGPKGAREMAKWCFTTLLSERLVGD